MTVDYNSITLFHIKDLHGKENRKRQYNVSIIMRPNKSAWVAFNAMNENLFIHADETLVGLCDNALIR